MVIVIHLRNCPSNELLSVRKRLMNFWTCSFCLCLSPSGLKCIKCCFHFFVTQCNTVANLDFTRRCNGFTCMAFNREASLGSCTKRNRLIKLNHRLFLPFCLIVPSEELCMSVTFGHICNIQTYDSNCNFLKFGSSTLVPMSCLKLDKKNT